MKFLLHFFQKIDQNKSIFHVCMDKAKKEGFQQKLFTTKIENFAYICVFPHKDVVIYSEQKGTSIQERS